ncbi:radical SAM family heme chaperone HemW [Synechococcus sp. PCC 7336]|uniref:radical SAM family heme chaperone HemW n=1 Tax=Synechococcus sp. PCC 7336 TaxID=195250 RepID=UPI00034ACB3E|nr:radical SAM family heme chaperone HemW [Synechococcus sp. PCC 7336]
MNFPSQTAIAPSPFAPPEAAYLHIPFCRRRCHYCDFATGRGTPELIERYVRALCRQIQQLSCSSLPLQTIFFGGGTPSLLSPQQLQQILRVLEQRQPFAPDIEISLEANPGTVDRPQLAGYREAGVNRISLGVQAFQAELLAACGRLHGVEEVFRAIEDLRAAGFENFSLDLMFGLPEQTLEQWQASLDAVVAIAPRHVSLYDLTIEAGTRFGRLYQPGDAPLPSDAETVQMYRMAIATLAIAGYDHYEISNFARAGAQCRHNRVYWENRSYHGLGMGATGYVNGRRYEQPRNLADYFQVVTTGQLPTAPVTPSADRLVDTLMLGLRLREGLSISQLENLFGSEAIAIVLEILQSYGDRGWASVSQGRLQLVPPEGWLFSNTILVELMAALSD